MVVGSRPHGVGELRRRIALLATLDLVAGAVPLHAEGTFFALLMSVGNLGTTGSEWLGGQLYDLIGLPG